MIQQLLKYLSDQIAKSNKQNRNWKAGSSIKSRQKFDDNRKQVRSLTTMVVVKIAFILSVGLVGILAHKHQSKELDAKYNWWQHEVFYQIYPRSFQDSNGDGIGDLQGITSRLQYFKDTGITSVWLSPIYESPMVDFGYDISNYTNIQPEYGTLEDFDALIAKANELGVKVILDFVPNHSSNKHPWFIKSVAREPGYEDFYVWEDGILLENGTRVPPNNWLSVFSGSAWMWNDERQQYYLRQFTYGQPDLNYRNPAVIKAMDDVMLFWLNKGIAGFRIDAIIYIYEDAQLRDEPPSGTTDDPNNEAYLSHIYTRNQPEDYGLLQHWRQLLDNYTANHDGPLRIMMTEGYASVSQLMEYYEDSNGVQGPQFPFNFDFITELNANSTAADFVFYISRWLIYMPHGHVANWVMGNHDNPRVASRFGEKSVDAMNMLLMTLPGIGITYNVGTEHSLLKDNFIQTFHYFRARSWAWLTTGTSAGAIRWISPLVRLESTTRRRFLEILSELPCNGVVMWMQDSPPPIALGCLSIRIIRNLIFGISSRRGEVITRSISPFWSSDNCQFWRTDPLFQKWLIAGSSLSSGK